MSIIPTKVSYLKTLPAIETLQPPKRENAFLFVVDQRVFENNIHVSRWLKKKPYVYLVNAGEELKNLVHLPTHLANIFKILGDNAHRGLTLVAIGGGSVGDFAGFIASIFKRGIDLIQIPSSWLAAIDSAHGGKNGLNIDGLKNQIGTFHHPKRVLIIERVLQSQSREQFDDALGELYKMALLTQKPWGRQLIQMAKISPLTLWKYLPLAVNEKYRIVSIDPRETKGVRHFLNLGHTFGHIIELEKKLPHGRSVAIGLKFTLAFSYDKGFLKESLWQKLQETPMFRYLSSITFEPLNEGQFVQILSQDKKKDSKKTIQFVFLKGFGKPLLQSISTEELTQAGKKYGFISSIHS